MCGELELRNYLQNAHQVVVHSEEGLACPRAPSPKFIHPQQRMECRGFMKKDPGIPALQYNRRINCKFKKKFDRNSEKGLAFGRAAAMLDRGKPTLPLPVQGTQNLWKEHEYHNHFYKENHRESSPALDEVPFLQQPPHLVTTNFI